MIKNFAKWTLVGVVLVAAGFGFYLGSQYERGAVAQKAPYKEIEKFSKVYEYVESNYVDPLESKRLFEGALRGMLQTLDPHSSYLNEEVYREMREETSGKFGGLGIEVAVKDNLITVLSPFDDTPAFRAGIKAGDQIVKIGGKLTKQMNLTEAINMMRGKVGSTLNISIGRKGEAKFLDFSLVRESIKMTSVKSALVGVDTGYFRISSFMERTAKELTRAYEKLNSAKKLQGVILDLRGNPGGLLDQAVKVTNLFVDEGPVVYTIGRDKDKKEADVTQKGRRICELPMVVLVDGSSASASEIVAGALQDYGRAVIAGQQTFGKGSVQSVIPLGDESGLKLTVARYFTPSGRSIQVKGITPDVRMESVNPLLVEELQNRERRTREADLEGHFLGDDGLEGEDSLDAEPVVTNVPAEKDPKKKPVVEVSLSLEDRLKKDYMVRQAEGILKTMSVIRGGLKKPEFKLEESEASKAKKTAKSE